MCYLINQDETLADKDRKLFGMLANRMIVKNAQSTSAVKVGKHLDTQSGMERG